MWKVVPRETPNPRIDTDAQTAAFVRCLGAGHAQRWTSCRASGEPARSVAIVTTAVMRSRLPPFKVSGALSPGVGNPSMFKASVCAQRTAGPQCKQVPSG